MRFLWFSLLSFLPSLVYAEGQVPVVDGVTGGLGPAMNTTPGKLRFKENTGFCGKAHFGL